MLDRVKEGAGVFGKGLLLQVAPNIAAGIINELFNRWKIDVAKVTEKINNNASLWSELAPEHKQELIDLSEKISLDFITPEFFINSIKRNFPGVASLFLNWPEAADWLTRQIAELKGGIKEHQPE